MKNFSIIIISSVLFSFLNTLGATPCFDTLEDPIISIDTNIQDELHTALVNYICKELERDVPAKYKIEMTFEKTKFNGKTLDSTIHKVCLEVYESIKSETFREGTHVEIKIKKGSKSISVQNID